MKNIRTRPPCRAIATICTTPAPTPALTAPSPTPWKIGYGAMEGDDYAVIVDQDHRQVCGLEPRHYRAANAALIVRAVNSHEALIDTLETVYARLGPALKISQDSHVRWILSDQLATISAALASAKAESK